MMEFNPDGSLKLPDSHVKKEKADRLQIRVIEMQAPKVGTEVIIEILDNSLPYNLVESKFQQVNNNFEFDCDAHLGKKSESMFDIFITGNERKKWIDTLIDEFSDFLDNALEIKREHEQ